MPLENIPLFAGQEAAILMGDETGSKEHHGALIDVYVDELGIIHRRPGLVEFSDFGSNASIDGIFWWNYPDWVLAASSGNSYKITDANGTNSQITHDNTDWAKSGRVIFADFKTSVYGADGYLIKKLTSTANVIDTADAQAPTSVSHVAVIDKYLLANNIDTDECHRSNVNAPDDWESNYFTPETKNDYLQAVITANQEVCLLGENTIEFFYDDGSTPFIRKAGGHIDSGTSAKYSFVYCDPPVNTLCWLDHTRTPVTINGRNTAPLNGTFAKYIQGFNNINDCRGDYAIIDGRPYYILSFPSENLCLVWDFKSELWYKWSYWNESRAEYERWRGNCFCYVPTWDFALVGDRNNGKVYKATNTAYQDDGDSIRSLIRTGRVVHQYSGREKKCKEVKFRLKRTALASGTVTILFRYRDNGKTNWHNWKTISLSQSTGTTETIVRYQRPMGTYYNRQWEIVCTDNIGFSIVSMQEDFEYL